MSRLTIPILTCFDDRFVIPAGVAFHSLAEHADPAHRYLIYVLHSDIGAHQQQRLRDALSSFDNIELSFMDMKGRLQDLFDETRIKSHYSKEMFYKLLAPSIFPQHEKMLITDVDVIFPGDVSRDYLAFDVASEFYLAGSPSLVRRDSWVDQFRRNYEKAFTPEEIGRLRIGAGYYVANLARMRDDGIEERFLQFARSNAHRLVQPEQDTLNLVCHPRIQLLPADSMVCTYCYDFYRDERDCGEDITYGAEEVKHALAHPVQLHFAGVAKPWNRPGSTGSERWFEALARTPFLRDHLLTIAARLDAHEQARELLSFRLPFARRRITISKSKTSA